MRFVRAVALIGALATAAGCKGTLEPKAADQASAYRTEYRPVSAIQVLPGFRAVLVVEGLNGESHSVAIPTLDVKVMRGARGELEKVALRGAGAPTGHEERDLRNPPHASTSTKGSRDRWT